MDVVAFELAFERDELEKDASKLPLCFTELHILMVRCAFNLFFGKYIAWGGMKHTFIFHSVAQFRSDAAGVHVVCMAFYTKNMLVFDYRHSCRNYSQKRMFLFCWFAVKPYFYIFTSFILFHCEFAMSIKGLFFYLKLKNKKNCRFLAVLPL